MTTLQPVLREEVPTGSKLVLLLFMRVLRNAMLTQTDSHSTTHHRGVMAHSAARAIGLPHLALRPSCLAHSAER